MNHHILTVITKPNEDRNGGKVEELIMSIAFANEIEVKNHPLRLCFLAYDT